MEENVVGDVDDEASWFPAIARSTQASTDHLLIQVRAVGWSCDIQRSHGGSIEALRQDAKIGEGAQPPRPELAYQMSPNSARRSEEIAAALRPRRARSAATVRA